MHPKSSGRVSPSMTPYPVIAVPGSIPRMMGFFFASIIGNSTSFFFVCKVAAEESHGEVVHNLIKRYHFLCKRGDA